MPGITSKTELKKDKLHWNLAVSEFITHLIAVKRGLNGRATPSLGIPASSISRPLPSELVSWLDKLTQEYAGLAQEAGRLVAEQNGLAQGLGAQRTASLAIESALAAQASWAGSRTWARAKWLITLKKDERQVRVRMLDETVDLLKSVEEFRRLMLKKKPDVLPKAMTEATRLAKQWLDPFSKSVVAHLIISSDLKKEISPAEEIPSEKSEEAKQEKNKSETENKETVKEPVKPKSGLKKIEEELPSILILVKFLKTNQLSNPKITGLENLTRQLYTAMAAFKQVSESDVPASIDLDKIKQEIELIYKSIIEFLQEFLGKGTIQSWLESLPDDFKSEEIEAQAFQVWQGFQKTAKRSAIEWLKEKWMGVSPTLLERLSLDILKTIQKLDDLLEEFMDRIERGDTSIDSLNQVSFQVMNKSGELILAVLNEMLTLSKFTHLDLRRDDKKSRRGIDNITELDFREIRITKDQVEQKLAKLSGK